MLKDDSPVNVNNLNFLPEWKLYSRDVLTCNQSQLHKISMKMITLTRQMICYQSVLFKWQVHQRIVMNIHLTLIFITQLPDRIRLPNIGKNLLLYTYSSYLLDSLENIIRILLRYFIAYWPCMAFGKALFFHAYRYAGILMAK